MIEKMKVDLVAGLGEKHIFSDADRLFAHDFDATDLHYLPDLVVEPVSTEQVSMLMKIASQYRIPVTPRGTGTGLTGGALAVHGGILLSMLRMDRILLIDEVNMIAVVQPGVINLHLHDVLAERGLYYPPDPASYETSSIGGNIAEDAGGPHCFKYGTTRDYVLAMTVVLPNGEIIKTGVNTRKGVVGYDLHDLIIGSEGTLGVVTEATLRLLPLPPAEVTLLSFMPAADDVIRLATDLTKKRITPAAMEFMDNACTELVRDRIPFRIPAAARVLLILELDGEEDVIQRQLEMAGELCLDHGAIDVLLADSSHKRKGLWDVRRKMRETIKERFTFRRAEDVVVPIGEISHLIDGSAAIADHHGFRNFNYGHVGDGNIHVYLTHDENTAAIQERGGRAFKEIFRLTLELGGTISGEHGIGVTKKPFLGMELSQESIRLQKEIKRIFDPLDIMNPGKIF